MTDLERAGRRFDVFADQVLEPAVFTGAIPLDVAAAQCADAIARDSARDLDFAPIDVGWRFGPTWSTAWFRVSGTVPAVLADAPLAFRFSCGTEALLWDGNVPRQGFDRNRDAYLLPGPLEAGTPVSFMIEAACNHPLGATMFWWDEPEMRARWAETSPGRLDRCELARFDATAWRLLQAYRFARVLLGELPDTSPRGQRLAAALAEATRRITPANLAGHAEDAAAALQEAIGNGAAASATRCHAVGHAHIDTAWLWPIRETRRKCTRTFASALRLMERFPDFTFTCSQAQQYAWIEDTAPALFEEITNRVKEGRWEATGAMWVEPDANVPSGESLVRQLLRGTRYWAERFGAAAPQRCLYLPDTFGFPATLPQIAVAAGLDTFITNKLAWNHENEFPYTSFRWRGLDGTEIVAHCTPGHEYNATNTPRELRLGEANIARKDKARTGVWLQPYGYGDGGGGPTDETIRRAELAADAEGLPRVAHASIGGFCDALHAARADLHARGEELPCWDGELYLEMHRGTYTTHAWLKRANRDAEHRLRLAEFLAFASPTESTAAQRHDARCALDDVWPLVLLNQFHDILPGSSIGAVYRDAREQYERVDAMLDALLSTHLDRWAALADTQGIERPMLVLNPTSSAAGGVVDCEGTLVPVARVPALGAPVIDRGAPANRGPAVEVDDGEDVRITNGVLDVTIDPAGRVGRMVHVPTGRLVNAAEDGAPAALNQLVLYEDRPRAWEAWDIDPEYIEKPSPVDGPPERISVIDSGPLRGAVEVTRPLGAASRITQTYVLEAGSPRLDVRTHVDWREERTLLRALFPVDVRSRHATYDIQFGHIERPTHGSAPREAAMFEVCAHRWMDLAERGFGVAICNDGTYGHSAHGNVMGLSLLRSPRFPDPDADREVHEFTYAIMPHDGDWQAAGVDRQAALLNEPLRAIALESGQAGPIEGSWAPFTMRYEGPARCAVSAFKPAADGDGVIVRFVETHGGRGRLRVGWSLPVMTAEAVDLLERPRDADDLEHDGTETTLELRPFGIVSLRARFRLTESQDGPGAAWTKRSDDDA